MNDIIRPNNTNISILKVRFIEKNLLNFLFDFN